MWVCSRLKDLVTAITFVALGTSLPDLFASKQAAATDKYADNAVGNVTGTTRFSRIWFEVPLLLRAAPPPWFALFFFNSILLILRIRIYA